MDFPLPLGPVTATNSPAGIARVTAPSAVQWFPVKTRPTARASINGSDIAGVYYAGDSLT